MGSILAIAGRRMGWEEERENERGDERDWQKKGKREEGKKGRKER